MLKKQLHAATTFTAVRADRPHSDVWQLITAEVRDAGNFDSVSRTLYLPSADRADGTVYRAFAAVVDQLLEDGVQII